MMRLHAAQITVLVGGMLLLAGMLFVVLSRPANGQAQAKGNRRAPLPSAAEIARLPADGGKEFNRLVHEKSPYLLQHARNPVDWYPWGPEAFARAKKENKPIFLSVGYSTCHWCHVMEHESFEREDVAAILNEHYVCVKVDREERPDVDQIYMLATQLLTGSGGWPNSVWLTPDGRPWFAGTYFPREDRGGQVGFKTLLTRLAAGWRDHNKDMLSRADRLAKALRQYSGEGGAAATGRLSYDLLDVAAREMAETFDPVRGGFGRAPKFPPHARLRLLLDLYRRGRDANALSMATRTLEAMALGGIHDHVAGGFHRYATDAVWLVPHFEKMLYDNAQLARAYVEAHELTGRAEFRRVAERTFDWVLREMRDPAGGFHSALDADSEGEEGKFYLWTPAEVLDVLGKAEGERFCRVYDIVEGGNWWDPVHGTKPGTSIPHLAAPVEQLAEKEKLPPEALRGRLAASRGKLLARRVKRVWPHRDDKVLTAWNALMISSLAHGGRVLDEPRYTEAAEAAANFLLENLRRKDGRLLRTWRAGSAKLNAYLDDYAFLADALLELHRATGEARWLDEAKALADGMVRHYADPAGAGFFFTAYDHEDLLVRTKDPTDGVLPAGNAVAAHALVRLARRTGDRAYLATARATLEGFQAVTARMPSGMAHTLLATAAFLDGTTPAGTAGRKPDAVADKKPVRIEAFAARAEAAPGETVEIELRLTVDPGWHVNSHQPGEGLVATEVALARGAPAELGTVRYPPGRNVKFPFRPDALSVYTGTVRLAVPVRLAADAKPGKAKLALLVTTQPCSDRACQASQTQTVGVEVTVASK